MNRQLFEATIAAVVSGLPLREVAEAMRAGWPDLDLVDAIEDVEVYSRAPGRPGSRPPAPT